MTREQAIEIIKTLAYRNMRGENISIFEMGIKYGLDVKDVKRIIVETAKKDIC